MAQAGFDTSETKTIFVSKSGFSPAAKNLAEQIGNTELVSAEEILN